MAKLMPQSFFHRYFHLLIVQLLFTSHLLHSECCSDRNFLAYGDFLYWRAAGEELDFASEAEQLFGVINATQDSRNIRNLSKNKTHLFDFHWDPGVRLGFICSLPCNDWQFEAAWTRFSTKSSGHVFIQVPSTSQEIIQFASPYDPGIDTTHIIEFPPESSLVIPNQNLTAKAHLKFTLNRVSLTLGSNFDPCNWFSIKPYFGLDVVFTRENLRYKRNLSQADSPIDPSTTGQQLYASRTNTKYYGAGLLAGLGLNLKFCGGWKLFGDMGISGLVGSFRVHRDTEIVSDPFNNTRTPISVLVNSSDRFHNDSWQGRVITDLIGGISYSYCLCDSYPIELLLQWEHHMLFNQTNFMYHNNDDLAEPLKHAGNLSLQGVTLSLGISF